jgi:Tol biopolymer transport system component
VRAWLVVALAGCGRIAFDAHGHPSDGAAVDTSGDARCELGPWGTPVPVVELNTGSEEAEPTVTADELTMAFESNRVGVMARGLWVSRRLAKTDPWGTAMPISEVDTPADENGPDLTSDGVHLNYTSSETGSAVLQTSMRNSAGSFTPEGSLSIVGDDVTPRYAPDVRADGLELYYGLDLDIAVATRTTTTMPFTLVRELDELDDPSTDGSPTISNDGHEIYFQSYRTGTGAIFRARREATGAPFGAPIEQTSLVPPGAAEVGTPELSADGLTLYYYAEVAGTDDLYMAQRSCL